jgi:PAS domain S-box-containing protein
MLVQMTEEIHAERAVPTGHEVEASLEEFLAFERLLSDLSVRFANVVDAQVIAEIESTLKQLLKFLGFDRGVFAEFTDEGKQDILCSVVVRGVEPLLSGPIPAWGDWFVRELRSGRTIVIRSYEDFPPEAAAAAEYYRRVGLRSQLVIPLPVGGRTAASIGFSSFRPTREWPDDFIARVRVIGEVMVQALVRKRSEAALRASEERWRSIFETSTLGITIFDQDLHYIATNQAFRALLGYTDEELRQLTPLDITVEEERGTAQMRLADLQQGKVDHYEVVKQYRRKDGKVLWAHGSVAQVAESRPKMFIGTMVDITESKRAQDAVEATRAELARAARMNRFGAMTASIAHEINQPLTAIAANTSAALRWLAHTTPNLDEARAALENAGRETHRAADVVEGIRAMFKNNSQNRVLLDINQLVREVLVLVQSELFKRRISLDTELTENILQVMADRVQLQQVIMNLVTNAMDAMEPIVDRQKLLRVESAIKDGDIVVVAIEDSGTGIDADKVDRLFDTFFTTKPNGMGMGLSICRSIIEAHNGRLGVSAGAQYGSVFRFELPTK